MPWDGRRTRPGAGLPRDDSLRADYVRLISIRRGHPALARGRHVSLFSEGDLLVFARRDSLTGDEVVVAVNRGAVPASTTLATPEGWVGQAADLWNQTKVPLTEGRLSITVEPKSARILVKE
jgi:glycosidase